MIAGYGMLAFRDPFGIRPLIIGVNQAMGGPEYLVASESVALEPLGFSVLRDVAPGEAIFVDQAGGFHARQCAESPSLNPCIFEYVYLARPDSVMDGTSVYEARLRMGGTLARKIRNIPQAGHRRRDRFRLEPASALELANTLGKTYREGLPRIAIGRTIARAGTRKKSVRQKLNPTGMEFKDRSFARRRLDRPRQTSREIVQMARRRRARCNLPRRARYASRTSTASTCRTSRARRTVAPSRDRRRDRSRPARLPELMR
jgi:amidophosphoribosyltransferase